MPSVGMDVSTRVLEMVLVTLSVTMQSVIGTMAIVVPVPPHHHLPSKSTVLLDVGTIGLEMVFVTRSVTLHPVNTMLEIVLTKMQVEDAKEHGSKMAFVILPPAFFLNMIMTEKIAAANALPAVISTIFSTINAIWIVTISIVNSTMAIVITRFHSKPRVVLNTVPTLKTEMEIVMMAAGMQNAIGTAQIVTLCVWKAILAIMQTIVDVILPLTHQHVDGTVASVVTAQLFLAARRKCWEMAYVTRPVTFRPVPTTFRTVIAHQAVMPTILRLDPVDVRMSVIMKHVVGPGVSVTTAHLDAQMRRRKMTFVTQPVTMKHVNGTAALAANTNTVRSHTVICSVTNHVILKTVDTTVEIVKGAA